MRLATCFLQPVGATSHHPEIMKYPCSFSSSDGIPKISFKRPKKIHKSKDECFWLSENVIPQRTRVCFQLELKMKIPWQGQVGLGQDPGDTPNGRRQEIVDGANFFFPLVIQVTAMTLSNNVTTERPLFVTRTLQSHFTRLYDYS